MTQDDKKQPVHDDRLKKAYEDTFSSTAGKVVLQDLMKATGYQQINMVLNDDGAVNEAGSFYNEGRRALYLYIRNFVKEETLISVEIRKENTYD